MPADGGPGPGYRPAAGYPQAGDDAREPRLDVAPKARLDVAPKARLDVAREARLDVAREPRLQIARKPRLDLDAALGGAAPDRLLLAAVLYLMLPALIFGGGYFARPYALATLALGGIGLVMSPGWRDPWPLGGRATLACGFGGLAWGLLASGTHHWLFAAVDWQIRDAVLHDLASASWPVAYAVGEQGWLLRAPIAYYLPAALAGQLAGPVVAQLALYFWTALGLALLLGLLATLARAVAPGRRHAPLLLAVVFVGFGGLDLLPNVWLDTTQGDGLASYWARGGEWWSRLFQYSGHVTAVLWVPNHALPAWLPALLLLRHARRAEFWRMAGLPLAAAAYWAPLSALGAGLLTAVAVLLGGWPALRAALAGPANWIGLALVVPAGLFLTAGSSAIPHGWFFAVHGWDDTPRLPLFLLVEVAIPALAVFGLVRSRLLAFAVGLLALLPLYVFGPGNEMVMRGGMGALALLAVAAGCGLLDSAPGWRRQALVAVLAVGAAGQLMEASILAQEPWPASHECSLPEAAAQSVFDATDWSHYVVPWPDDDLAWFLRVPRALVVDPDSVAGCWPDPKP